MHSLVVPAALLHVTIQIANDDNKERLHAALPDVVCV